ncbi:MAG: tetratricopeptide repeat protein [Planctomycetes bacterium]|nr:tetratricopeptide repeat protein [Planctomycetota bacterium]
MRGAHLEASVLLAEGLPYRVIDRLEPYLQSRNFSDSMRGLLAEAFRRTRQQGRIAALYRSDSTGAIEGPIPALMTIEAMLRGGHIEEAARVLGELERLNPNSIELQLLRMDIDLLMAAQDTSDTSNAVRKSCESKLRELLRSRISEQEVRSRLALLIAADGRVDEGELLLKQAIADDPDSQDQLLNLARFYSLCNMRREALATLRKTIDLFPSSAQPRLELADSLLLAQDREAARQILAAALDAVSADSQSNISRRLAAIELADDSTNASGMHRMKQLAEADPQDIEARSLLLQSSVFRSDSVAAQKAIEEIKAIEGESGQRWRYHQAQLDLDGMTDDEGAEQQARRQGIEDMLMMCINRDPAWSQPVLLLGAYYERLDQYEKAAQLYRRSLDANPDSAVAGQLLLQLETRHRFKEALNVMDRYPAVFNAPEFGARRLTIAMDSGDSDLISRQLEFQSGRNAQDPQILILSAMLTFSRNRDVAEAQRILQSALDAGADPLAVASTRVGILKGAGQINEAKRILDDMVTASPTFEVRLLRGAFLDSIGDVSAAEADYKELPLLASDVRGFAHLTDFYAEKKRFAEAVSTIEAGLDKYPDALDLKRGLLKILLTRRSPDDLSRAESVIGSIDSNTMDTDLLWVQTVLAEHKGGADAAQNVRHLLERATQHPKASLEVYRGLVNTALRLKETSVAEKLLNAAGREHGEDLPALNVMRAYLMIAKGEALLSLGYLRQARVRGRYDFSVYECLLALTPYLANSVALGEFLDPLEAALAQSPNDVRLRIIHARLLQHQGRSSEAAEQLAAWFKSKESSPESDARILLTLVDLFAASGNIKEAEANLERLMAIDPKSAAVRTARINLLALQSQYDEISKIGTETLDDESLSKTERLNLAFQAAQLLSLSNDASRTRLALAAYQRIAALEPKSVSAALGIAICFGQLGEIDDAIRSYRMAIEYDPNRDEALNNLAWLLTTEKSNAAEAVQFARRAVELKPQEPAYRDTLGEILQRLPNRLSEAVDQFARASELYGHSDAKRAHSLLKLAVVCHRLQRDAEAKRYLEAARRIDASSRIESQTGALSESDRATLNQLSRELNPSPTQSLDSMAP